MPSADSTTQVLKTSSFHDPDSRKTRITPMRAVFLCHGTDRSSESCLAEGLVPRAGFSTCLRKSAILTTMFFKPSRAFALSFFVGVFLVGPAPISKASVPTKVALPKPAPVEKLAPLTAEEALRKQVIAKAQQSSIHQVSLIFDIPVTFNARVSHWLTFFQGRGKTWFREWLEKATKYMPFITKELRNAGLPADLGYIVMIESGFEPNAKSVAAAVGPWQFIEPTGRRYGLKQTWWLDERRDLMKATQAATRYLRDLHAEFGSWYLVAASYNMGENGLRRKIKANGTRDFWSLAHLKALPQETTDYVPKILAAMLIAKAPGLYGFRDLSRMKPLEFDLVEAGGGTDLALLADHLGVTHKALKDMNAELLLGYIPVQVEKHTIRVPKGAAQVATNFLRKKYPIAGGSKSQTLDKGTQRSLNESTQDPKRL